ncbi:MAG: HemK2/MTQ2 family protein methyltransferase [Candidatus Pacearchaeota archaeon]
MYEPREDSLLLLKHIKNSIKPQNKVLDMGTGSGILAKEASRFSNNVVAADISEDLQKSLGKINIIHSDLFSNINDRFDVILFNPPYLPSKEIKHIDLDGGKNGTEVIDRFLKQAREHLETKGKILLLCSSLNKNIENLFKKYNYTFRKIDESSLFFEKLFVYELR